MLTGKELNREIRQVGFVIMLVILLGLMVFELKYFLSAALGAFTLYVLLRRPHRYLVSKGWKKMPVTILLVFGTILVIFGLGGALASLVVPKIMAFNPHIIVEKANKIHDFVLQSTGYNIFSKEIVDKAIQSASKIVPNVFVTTGGILINGFMTFVLLFFMLQAREKLEKASNYLPLGKESIRMLSAETRNMVFSNAIGIPLVVLGQSVVSGLGYWMLDAGNPVLCGLLTGVASLIPVAGGACVWGTLAINLMVGGQIWQGIVLILYGALITANVDNVIRMYLLNKYADVHPVITLFGIILGLNLFGFWGIIFGPLMISGFILLIKIYRIEFLDVKPEAILATEQTPPGGQGEEK